MKSEFHLNPLLTSGLQPVCSARPLSHLAPTTAKLNVAVEKIKSVFFKEFGCVLKTQQSFSHDDKEIREKDEYMLKTQRDIPA